MILRSARNAYEVAFGLVLWAVLLPLAHAQSTADLLAGSLWHRVSGEHVILQNFSAEPLVRARVQANGVDFLPTKLKAFSLVDFGKVSVSGSQITLRGMKHYLIRRASNQLARFSVEEPIELVVDVDPGLDPQAVPSLASQFFFDTVNQALGAVPAVIANSVPENADALQNEGFRPKTKPDSKAGCDCSDAHPRCADGGPQHGITPPKLVKQADAIMPAGTSPGSVLRATAVIVVGIDGRPSEIWMLHASTVGAAASAFEAIAQYRFQPLSCHGTPLQTSVTVETNFEHR